MRSPIGVARTLLDVCAIALIPPASLGAQSAAYFQPLSVPPCDVGTCIAPPVRHAGSSTQSDTRSRLVMTSRTPSAHKEMFITRDRAGKPVLYVEMSSVSTGILAGDGNDIIARLRSDGSVAGSWQRLSIQMSDSGKKRLDTASLRVMQERAIRHSNREPLNAAAQRKVRVLVEWLNKRCPA